MDGEIEEGEVTEGGEVDTAEVVEGMVEGEVDTEVAEGAGERLEMLALFSAWRCACKIPSYSTWYRQNPRIHAQSSSLCFRDLICPARNGTAFARRQPGRLLGRFRWEGLGGLLF